MTACTTSASTAHTCLQRTIIMCALFANPAFDAESKREIMLLRPLFFASFLVHDLLAERVGTDADTIAITSASSKTAIGLAHLLSTHKGPSLPYRWTDVGAKP